MDLESHWPRIEWDIFRKLDGHKLLVLHLTDSNTCPIHDCRRATIYKELQKHLKVHRNRDRDAGYVLYRPRTERNGIRYEDFMRVYRERASSKLKALYEDRKLLIAKALDAEEELLEWKLRDETQYSSQLQLKTPCWDLIVDQPLPNDLVYAGSSRGPNQPQSPHF